MSGICYKMLTLPKPINGSMASGIRLSLPSNQRIGNNLQSYSRCLPLGSQHLHTQSESNKGTSFKSPSELIEGKPKTIFEKEFPEYFHEGKFITRISYVDFIDQSLGKMKELGLERNIEAYKELLRVFPPGKYSPKSKWDFGLPHAPQQLAALRILLQMDINRIRFDREIEEIVISAFSKRSQVWIKVARGIYWGMKGRNVDPNPIPEKLPDKPYDLAKAALARTQTDFKSLITLTKTSSVPDAIDKTWIVYSQSPTQKQIIEELDEKSILYIEDHGTIFIGDKFLSYFVLKYNLDESEAERKNKEPEPDFNYNTCKMQFYGKPIREKLQSIKDKHYSGNGYILSTCLTGTSSQDSALSWLKILQRRNPKLSKLNVVFKLSRPTMDLVDPDSDPEREETHRKKNEQNFRYYPVK